MLLPFWVLLWERRMFVSTTKNVFLIIIFSVLFFLISFSQISVTPLSVEKYVRPGETITETFYILPGNTTQQVSIELFQLVQDFSGNFNYEEVDPDSFLYSSWIQYDNLVTVPAGTTTATEVKINIPMNAPFGTYNFILMFTPRVETSGQLGIIIRYAIRLTIHVEGITITQIRIDDLEVVPNEERRPTVVTSILNDSSFDLIVSIEAVLRDQKGKIIERFPLKTQYMERNNLSAQRILKGNKVMFYGTPKYLLSPGDYKLNLFVNYSDRQKVFTFNITVPAEGFSFAPLEELALVLDQNEFSFTLYPGAVKSFVVGFQNLSNKNVTVKIGAKDFPGSDRKYSLISWLTSRSTETMVVYPQRPARAIMSISVPKDAQEGGYYGKIVLNVYDELENLLTQKEVNIELIIGKVEYDVELVSTNYEVVEGIGIFSAVVKNIGSGYLIPKGSLSIINSKGVSIGVYDLVPSSEEWVVPEKEVLLLGEVPDLDISQDYSYILTIYNKENKLKTFEGTFFNSK